ncbi:type 1 glutamine amidotransferase [Amycolatopsis anabasis]|uniref:type 1 glutamine amidotransferase n=1 Tax=Amycolatopsis anabasis TaxID=1840409 RepID=UPI00131A8118|nr:hypothetical protein [Amycolatopsis anabasis]
MSRPGATTSPRALVVDNGSLSTRRIAELVHESGWWPEVVPHREIPRNGREFAAIVLTGTDVPAWEPGYEAELELIRAATVPVLGICGGLHLIGRAYGVGLGRGPAVVGGSPVTLLPGVELFSGLPGEVRLFQRHVYGLVAVPPGFALTATSGTCRVEGIRHRRRALYGMQAHLEFRRDGKRIFRNFLDRARRGDEGAGR